MSTISPQRAMTSRLYGGGGIISTAQLLQGLAAVASVSTAWPAANLGIFIPFRILTPVIVYKFAVAAGLTAAGNFDVGIYDNSGNKIIASGSTAKGSNIEQILDVTDTYLGPGNYYLALAANGTNNYVTFTPSGTTPAPLQKMRLSGVVKMASAFSDGLVQVATFAAMDQIQVPSISALLRPY